MSFHPEFQTKESFVVDLHKPLMQSCRLASSIPGSTILSLSWNASNYRDSVTSSNQVKKPLSQLRNKSLTEYQSDTWNLIVIAGIIGVVSLTTQAAALITFGKWGLRNNQPSQGEVSLLLLLPQGG